MTCFTPVLFLGLKSEFTFIANVRTYVRTSQVLVFNCDEGIDVKSMGRIFIGLVKCGAWGCFDEFNRLEEAVLSAVSMQIQTIQAALRVKAPQCELLDRQVRSTLLTTILIAFSIAVMIIKTHCQHF